ncbi:PH domain-containing protein [Nocardioides sp. AE5]|uniref:PH domain-containing protein n=1 Tax=Nocardioides sp. AE5 TaxID=2962573 RepID=UPI002881CF2B|nr:PH domain-containing protein [Nocardioides sp. AE5]MDT0201907.1 PH domain-containing protein [Nocardioides sp. AE5]
MAISKKYLNEGEAVIVSTRTHAKALFVPILVLLVMLAGAGYLTTVGEGTTGKALTIGGWAVAAVVIIWFVLRPFLVWWSTTYTFTNRRFMERTGIIAQSGRTIPLNRISGVDFEIDLTDRLFGCGTLVVTDASEAGRVELHDIPRVEKVQLKVADELHRLYGKSDDGT